MEKSSWNHIRIITDPVYIKGKISYKKTLLYLLLIVLLVRPGYCSPLISFDPSSTPDGAVLYQPNVSFNISIHEQELNNLQFVLNNFTYGIYSNSLIFATNFDNNSFLDNSTSANDISPNRNPARLIDGNQSNLDGNSPPYYEKGVYGNALKFDGIDDYLDVGNSSVFNSGSITINLWLYLSSNPNCDNNNNWRSLLHKGGSSSTRSGYDLILEEDRSLTFDVGNGVSSQRYNGGIIPLMNWTFLALTYNPITSESRLFINGLETGGSYWSRTSGSIGSNSNSLLFNTVSAKCPSNGNGAANMSIDEVRIFNRVLSPEEIYFSYWSNFVKINSTHSYFYANMSYIGSGDYNYYINASNSFGETYQTPERTFRIPCIEPTLGTQIFSSSVLCPGDYSLGVNSNQGSVITIKRGDLTISGNLTTIIGSNMGKGIAIENLKNVSLQDLHLSDFYYAFYVLGSQNISINNIKVDTHYPPNMSYGIYADHVSQSQNISIINSQFENFSNFGLYLSGLSHYVYNNTFLYNSSYRNLDGRDGGIKCEGGSTQIVDNTFINLDVGIYLGGNNARNIIVRGNRFKNITRNADWYDTGIFVYSSASNISIINNNFTNTGTTAILIQKNCSNITIQNNYIDLYNVSKLSSGGERIFSNDAGEPPSGVFITGVYKMWLSDSTESFDDNINKIKEYTNKNIRIVDNQFGPNVQVYIRSQGTKNLTHNLDNFKIIKIQFPTHLAEPDEFYLSPTTKTVYEYKNSITELHDKGYGDITSGRIKYMIQYVLNTSSLLFRNSNNTIIYNVSLIEPRNVLFNLSSHVSAVDVNVSLPVNMLWYHTVNFTITPSSGLLDVLVTDYRSGFVGWFENRSTFGTVNYGVCAFSPGASVVYRVNGVLVDVFVANSSGCVNFGYGGGTERTWMDLTPAGIGVMDLSVSSSDFVLPSSGVVGSSMVLNATVHNSGSVSSGQFYVRFMVNGSVIGSQRVSGLAAGASTLVNVSWVMNASGFFGLWVAVDYNNSVSESDELDNSVVKVVRVVGPADLSVVPSDIIFSVDEPRQFEVINISATVRNLGDVDAGNAVVECYDGLRGSGSLIGSSTGDVLAGGYAFSSWLWNASVLNTHMIYVYVDYLNVVNESSEGNNVGYRGLFVSALNGSTTTSTSTTSTLFNSSTTSSTSSTLNSSTTSTIFNSSTTTSSTTSSSVTTSTLAIVVDVLPDMVLGSKRGVGVGDFYDPCGVCLDLSDNVWVVERSNSRVQEFDENGSYLGVYGSVGDNQGFLDEPSSITVRNASGNRTLVYIADTQNYRVDLLWINGSMVNWSSFGERGSVESINHIYFRGPVALDYFNNSLYVLDSEASTVEVFNHSNDSAVVVPGNRFGVNMSVNGARGLEVTNESIYVADSGSNRVKVFSLNGSLIKSFGSYGSGKGYFNNPRGITVDEEGYVYVLDSGNGRVVVYNQDNKLLSTFGRMNCSTSIYLNTNLSKGQFCNPEGITAGNGKIYVADTGNQRVQVFNISTIKNNICSIAGKKPPCNQATLSEVIETINLWKSSQAELTDAINVISLWSG